jgi:Sec-independent protein translocase protein TatA
MEFLGIGPLELLFIIVIIIVVIGPKDIQRTMRGLGRGLNALYKSDGWRAFTEVSRELRGLPNRLVREAELEELEQASKEINQAIAATTPNLSAWTTPTDGKQTSPPGAAQPAPAKAAPPAAAQAASAAPAQPLPAAPEAEPERTIGPAEAPARQAEPAASANGDAAPKP